MFPLPHFPPLLNRADFSTPAFSTPAEPCRCFHSRIFHPCILYRADVSTPAFSAPPFIGLFIGFSMLSGFPTEERGKSNQQSNKPCAVMVGIQDVIGGGVVLPASKY